MHSDEHLKYVQERDDFISNLILKIIVVAIMSVVLTPIAGILTALYFIFFTGKAKKS